VVNLWARPGEEITIRALSDLHIDEKMHSRSSLRRTAARDMARSKRPRAVIIGDLGGLIFPTDVRRFHPSGQRKQLQGVDDWLDTAIEYVCKELEALGYAWDVVGMGNHERTAMHHHGTDVVSRVAERLGAARGGFSGVIDYRIHVTKDGEPQQTKDPYALFRIVYHHGAWGGRYAKGYLGAWPFFAQHDGWNVALYGHNHLARLDPEVRVRVQGKELKTYPVFLANLASFRDVYGKDSRSPDYGEVKGFMRGYKGGARISVVPRWSKASSGNGSIALDYEVTYSS